MAHGPVARKAPINADTEEDDDEFPVPPDGGWGWMVAFASFAIHIVTDGITYSLGMFYEEFLDYFDEGKGYTAWILSLLVGVTLCSGPISSSFVNRYGCRAVTIAGSILGGVSLAVSYFAQNVLTLIFTVGLGAGLGFGLIYLPAIVSVTTYFEKYRSLATGIAVCGSGLGTFIFAPLNELLIAEYGWRGAMLILSGVVFNCIVFGAMFRPLEPPKKKKIQMKPLKYTDEQVPLNSNTYRLDSNDSQNVNDNDSDNRLSVSHTIPRSVSIGQEMTNTGHRSKTNSLSNNNLNGDKKLRPTWSQPLLSGSVSQENNMVMARKNTLSGSGMMYRPDVFYQGSLMNIPQYRSRGELSIPNENRSAWQKPIVLEEEETAVCFNLIPCSRETKDTLNEIMDFSIFRDPVFIIFVISNFCTSVGFNVPYVFIAPRAEELGLTKKERSYLLATIGIANTVGRILLGYISDKPWVNRLLVYNACLTVCGISTALCVICYDYVTLTAYSIVFGFTIGAYVGLTSVILVDLLGLEKLTNAFGLLLLFQGIASLVGPPFAGWLYDMTQSYSPAFLMAGIMIAISGLVLFAIPPMQRHIEKRNAESELRRRSQYT